MKTLIDESSTHSYDIINMQNHNIVITLS